jgi:hypothetical protein
MFAADGFQAVVNVASGYYYNWDYALLQPTLIYAPRNLTGAV